jgi:flagellar hook-associated protein 1 FlgK
MITPGFFGLYNAHRGLLAAQSALNTINNNISNANTPGYSRQRVDLAAYNPYTDPSLQQIPGGQLGQGPIVQQITRSRDQFLDAQYRQANGLSGLDSAIRDGLQQVQGVINEPSDSGINTALQNFFDAAQELSVHPESIPVRSDFTQQAVDLVTVFQQQAQQLSDLRKNLVGDPSAPSSFGTSQLAITAKDVNDKLDAITKLNLNIVTVKSSGAQPNDLLDQRDKLLDDLSKLVDIKVTNYDNGQIDLTIGGQAMIHGAVQVDSLQVTQNPGPAPLPDDVPSLISTVNGGVVLNDGAGAEITGGTLTGISNMGGNDPTLSTVRGVLGKLDTLIGSIANQINALQSTGRDLNGALGAANPVFISNPALNPGQALGIFHWTVNTNIVNDPKLIAAAQNDPAAAGGYAGPGDGRNALTIAQLRNQTVGALGSNFVDYLNGIVSKLGIDTRSYENSSTSQGKVIQSVDNQRQSVSGVNIDEETVDLLRYQRAFEATSKVISILDQITQSIINMVG